MRRSTMMIAVALFACGIAVQACGGSPDPAPTAVSTRAPAEITLHTPTAASPSTPTPGSPPTAKPARTATLWCTDCAAEGIQVNLWGSWDRSNTKVVGRLPHGTPVQVLEEKRHPTENRMYYRVQGNGQTGWVPETLIRQN